VPVENLPAHHVRQHHDAQAEQEHPPEHPRDPCRRPGGSGQASPQPRQRDRRRRIGRQDVILLLVFRQAEKQDRHGEPDQEQHESGLVLVGQLRPVAAPHHHSRHEQQAPRREISQKNGQVIERPPLRPEIFDGEAADTLHHQQVVDRVQTHHPDQADEPGKHQRGENAHRQARRPDRRSRQFTPPGQIGRPDQGREGDRHRPLPHEAKPEARTHPHQVQRPAVSDETVKIIDRRRDEEQQDHVDEASPAHDEESGCQRDDAGGRPGGGPAGGQLKRQPPHHDQRGQGEERDHQTLRPDAYAHQAIRDDHQPVGQRRLVQTGFVVERGIQGGVVLHHLPGRLDVERLVGIPDARSAGVDQVEGRQQGRQGQRDGFAPQNILDVHDVSLHLRRAGGGPDRTPDRHLFRPRHTPRIRSCSSASRPPTGHSHRRPS